MADVTSGMVLMEDIDWETCMHTYKELVSEGLHDFKLCMNGFISMLIQTDMKNRLRNDDKCSVCEYFLTLETRKWTHVNTYRCDTCLCHTE
jgi:hypothetical protein